MDAVATYVEVFTVHRDREFDKVVYMIKLLQSQTEIEECTLSDIYHHCQTLFSYFQT